MLVKNLKKLFNMPKLLNTLVSSNFISSLFLAYGRKLIKIKENDHFLSKVYFKNDDVNIKFKMGDKKFKVK